MENIAKEFLMKNKTDNFTIKSPNIILLFESIIDLLFIIYLYILTILKSL